MTLRFFLTFLNTRAGEELRADRNSKGGRGFLLTFDFPSTFQVEWTGSGVSDLKTLSLSCFSRVHEKQQMQKKTLLEAQLGTVPAAWPWLPLPQRALEALAA